MQKKVAGVELEERRFNEAASHFLNTLLPEVVEQAVRKMAFDVVDETARGLNGAVGLPKRIDTGRLRAGWRVAMMDGGLDAPPSAASAQASEAGDGEATVNRGLGGRVVGVEVRNNVEYARDVEEGTESMAPGKHLERALRVIRIRLPKDTSRDGINARMQKAWKGGHQ